MTEQNIKKVFITGATGFLGSALAKRLLAAGYDVAVSLRKTSSTGRIADCLDRITTFELEIKDGTAVDEAVSRYRPDAVIHLATYYKIQHSEEDIPIMDDTNVKGTAHLLEAARKNNVKLFVNTSSCFVYEQSKNGLKEDGALKPINLYAETKIKAEQACSRYASEHGLNIVTLRIFAPYGPGDHQRRLIPFLTRSLLEGSTPDMTSGKQKWDFVYVDDIIDAYCCVLCRWQNVKGHEIFNIGTSDPVSVHDIGMKIKEILNSDITPLWGAVKHRDNEIWYMCADITKAQERLQWAPKVRILERGLELTVRDIKKNCTNKGERV